MDDKLIELLGGDRVIPSSASLNHLKYVAEKTSYHCIMLKMGDINSINKLISYIHKCGKKVMLHIDSIKGISKDRPGIHYLKRLGTDSIVTMKSQNIKMIKEEGIFSILGTFLVDSSSVALTVQNIHSNKPDAVIAMPMTIPDNIYARLQASPVPILAGGLGVNAGIINHVLSLGVHACAVTDTDLLNQYGKIPGSKYPLTPTS